ncbi:hypothetical protein ABZP36_011039 [Zizania latifolia]
MAFSPACSPRRSVEAIAIAGPLADHSAQFSSAFSPSSSIGLAQGECRDGKPSSPYPPRVPNLADTFNHSWEPAVKRWIWVPRGAQLSAAVLGLGLPAREEEIRRFGSAARRIRRSIPRLVNSRSFAEVLRDSQMDQGRTDGRLGGKRRPVEGIDEGRRPQDFLMDDEGFHPRFRGDFDLGPGGDSRRDGRRDE